MDTENEIRTIRPNEYTKLEDITIVQWLSTGDRAYYVKGTLVWQHLARNYEKLTGRVRSWASLRSRYLRQILRFLDDIGLPPAQVTQLRDAAAVGVRKLNNLNQQATPQQRHRPDRTIHDMTTDCSRQYHRRGYRSD